MPQDVGCVMWDVCYLYDQNGNGMRVSIVVLRKGCVSEMRRCLGRLALKRRGRRRTDGWRRANEEMNG